MEKKIKRHAVELLAPAGTTESLVAAINSGANAVYLGLTEFNARMRSRNFSMKTLSYAVPYAHARNVKVYVAFNILVKQAELERAVHLLYQLEQIGIDGLIIQDMGVLDIVRTTFPGIPLHASTQMSVHNSAGVEACRRLGLKRVVVARELTCGEITKICASTKLEIEVFIHGALCYSLSGMCLASSFFGGASGNRGRCTQVCRRSFDLQPGTGAAEGGYFFSPNDLCALDALPHLIQAGVRSLKIEGRMKGPEYVSTVVSAFRMVLDDPSKATTAKEMLRHDLGRRKTGFFLMGGINQSGIIDAKNPPGTGIFIGKIETAEKQTLSVRSKERINPGDVLRIQPQSGLEGIMVGALKCIRADGVLTVTLDKEIPCRAGDSIFCVGREKWGNPADIKLSARPVRYFERYKDVHAVLRAYRPAAHYDKNRDRRLFIKIDRFEWLERLTMPGIGGIVCAFDRKDMLKFAQDTGVRERLARAAYIEPPPFIPEEELGEWRRLMQTLCKDGQCGLLCQNLGHAVIEPGVKRMRADYMLWCMNRAAHHAYASLHLSHFAYSLEDDFMNIRECASQQGTAYLFGHVPLFVSRIRPALSPGSRTADRAGRKSVVVQKNGLYYCVAEEIVCLFHKREKFEELGISTFGIDLSFMEPDEKILQDILTSYSERTRYPGSCLFNLKGGLR